MGDPREKLWTKDFVLLTVCNLLLFMTVQTQTPTFPIYAKEVYLTDDFLAGLTVSFFAIGAVIARVFTGEALKTKSSKALLIIGLCIVGMTTAGYYWIGSIAFLLLMRAIFGIGFGIGSTTLPTIVTNAVPLKRIGEGMGYYGLSNTLAMAIGPMIGLAVLSQFGFGPMLILGVTCILVIFPLLSVIRAYSRPSRTTPIKETGLGRFYDKKILLPAFLNFCMSITYGGLMSFLALYGKEAHIDNISWFFLIDAAAIVLVRPISGKLLIKKGMRPFSPPGAIFVGLGLLALSLVSSTWILAVAAVLYGMGYGCIQPSIQAWMVKEVRPEQRGMANGFFLNSIDLGIAIGAIVLGPIATHASYAVMYRWSSVFMLLFLVVYFLSQRSKRGKAVLPANQNV